MANPITEAERFEALMDSLDAAAGVVEIVPEERRHFFEGSTDGLWNLLNIVRENAYASADRVPQLETDQIAEWKRGVPYELRIQLGDNRGPPTEFTVKSVGQAHPSEGGIARLIFDDDSSLVYHWFPQTGDEGGQREERPRDHITRLLEPIEREEYAGIEVIIHSLLQLLDRAELSPQHAARAQAAIQVLHGTHRAIEVGETKRAPVLVSLAAGVGVIFGLIPKAIVETDAALEVIARWYPILADLLRQSSG